MNRTAILDLLEGRLTADEFKARYQADEAHIPEHQTSFRPPPDVGTEVYVGEFTHVQAKHLLKRTTYGPTAEMIEEAVEKGLDWTVDKLLEDLPLPSPPLVYDGQADPNVNLGETWVDAPYAAGFNLTQRIHRRNSLVIWQMGRQLSGEFSAREKMTLFWHNHFALEQGVVTDGRYLYNYITTLRENAFGNFRELAKMITLDPAMLRYLNGNQNEAAAPNENYARELLELFTIGKGPTVGEGDYTHFTEQDVLEGARILTGWRDLRYFDPNGDPLRAVFNPIRHDSGSKTLSHRFDNVVIENMGEDEYAHFIDIIFTKDECARFLARKLYRWFVYYHISDVEEEMVIEPLAQVLIDNDYNIKPMLRALFRSAHFYDELNYGTIIKNPFDFVGGHMNEFKIDIEGESVRQQYEIWLSIAEFIGVNQMVYFAPPSVSGWPAYHQAPSYNRIWTNSVTLPLRMLYTDILTLAGFQVSDKQVTMDFLSYVATYENPLDPNALIDESIRRLLPKDLEENQKQFLKDALLPGLPDFEWTEEYALYLSNPDDEGLRLSVDAKLRSFFRTLLLLPEYHLS